MANTYYDSELTAGEIEEVLEAINGILTPANNGKVLAISNGKFEARSVQWGGGGEAVIEPLSVTQNGTYTAPSGVDGYSPVTANVEPKLYPPEDPDYIMDHAGDLICTISGRPYYKTTSDKAYVAYMYNGSYTGPFLISEVADGVKYTTEGQTFSYSIAVVHNNKTYYVGNQAYWQGGNQTSSNGFAKKLSNSALDTNAAIAELFNKAGSNEFYVTLNGLYPIPSGYDGYKEVVVDTQANVQTLNVTRNGTYNPPSGVDGYAPVTVNVSGGGGSGTKTLLWENQNPLSDAASVINLNDDFRNYDFLCFVNGYTNNVNVRSSIFVDCIALEDLLTSGSYYFLREADCNWNFTVTDATTFTRYSAFYLSPKAVYGYKL